MSKLFSNSLTTTASFGLLDDPKDYWATHFLAILRFLMNHRTYQYNYQSLQKRLGNNIQITLRDMRGEFPERFFKNTYRYIINWGFQYFLASFLNHSASLDVVKELLNRLQDAYGEEFPDKYDSFYFHMAGNDSNLSRYTKGYAAEIFPSYLESEQCDGLFMNSDLCLVLTKHANHTHLFDRTIGMFGEVEGGKGKSLATTRYWKKKNKYNVFCIGVVDEPSYSPKSVYFDTKVILGIPRVHVTLSRNHDVVADFLYTITAFDAIFRDGNYTDINAFRGDNFKFFVNLLIRNMGTSLPALDYELARYTRFCDLVGYMNNSNFSEVPSIIS